MVIPDTQVKPGVPIDHLAWIGQYIVDQFSGRRGVRVIHLGDHWDMPSLSSYDKGKKAMEGRRYVADIAAGNRGMAVLSAAWPSRGGWKPELHLLRGNHEDRIQRAIDNDPQMDGLLHFGQLESPGWKVHEYLKPVMLDGVAYCHVFVNPMSGRPLGGLAATRLKTIGCSFTMGHQQLLDHATRYVLGRQQRALICGSAYLHDEDYRGFQGNNSHWRGILVCHEVDNGSYDLMEVSLDFLCRKYEGKPLAKFKPKVFA